MVMTLRSLISLSLVATVLTFQLDAKRAVAGHRQRQRTKLAADGLNNGVVIDRHKQLIPDIAAFEASRGKPLVRVGESNIAGAGRGVFATRDIAAGETMTEWVGLLLPDPGTRSEEIERQQEYYGKNWRDYSGRYEIGLFGSAVPDAVGVAKGGAVVSDGESIECDVEEGLTACLSRAGSREFILYGKPVALGARAAEGVAQLINDHSNIVAPARGAAMREARAGGMGSGAGALTKLDVAPLDKEEDIAGLLTAVAQYTRNIAKHNNIALTQAAPVLDGGDAMLTGVGAAAVAAPRVFAMATRPIAKGEELYYSYGTAWWLTQLRRAVVAQMVSCSPPPALARQLSEAIYAIEAVSAMTVDDERDAVGAAGCMPRDYVVPLEPLDLDSMFDDDWAQKLLFEEFSTMTECPVESIYEGAF